MKLFQSNKYKFHPQDLEDPVGLVLPQDLVHLVNLEDLQDHRYPEGLQDQPDLVHPHLPDHLGHPVVLVGGPASPGGPATPCGPAGPSGPTVPAGPSIPVKPVAPVGPISPGGPSIEGINVFAE